MRVGNPHLPSNTLNNENSNELPTSTNNRCSQTELKDDKTNNNVTQYNSGLQILHNNNNGELSPLVLNGISAHRPKKNTDPTSRRRVMVNLNDLSSATTV